MFLIAWREWVVSITIGISNASVLAVAPSLAEVRLALRQGVLGGADEGLEVGLAGAAGEVHAEAAGFEVRRVAAVEHCSRIIRISYFNILVFFVPLLAFSLSMEQECNTLKAAASLAKTSLPPPF